MSSDSEDFEIVTVQSGARSLRSLACGETFHPVIGPMAEARELHVVQQRLRERAERTTPFVIWDVGLGAAANAIAALEALRGKAAKIYSFDRTTAPLEFALQHADELGYLTDFRSEIETLLTRGYVSVGEITWNLCAGDFATAMLRTDLPAPHALLYDPYSPNANPGLWTLEHFTALHARLDPARSCLLTNYTRSTAVRVTLLLAGFFVGRGGATGEKQETTTAANCAELITHPLERLWLERVARSTRGAPLRVGGSAGIISAEDLARLHAHPQFNR